MAIVVRDKIRIDDKPTRRLRGFWIAMPRVHAEGCAGLLSAL